MAGSVAAEKRTVRCPYCLSKGNTTRPATDTRKIRCRRCRKMFQVSNALPYKRDTKEEEREEGLGTETDGNSFINLNVNWAGRIALIALCCAVGTFCSLAMRGPTFLYFYGGVFVAVFIGFCLAKIKWRDENWVHWVAFLIFEGIGVSRLITGVMAGMHKFLYLFIMMGIGGLIFTMKLLNSSSGGSSGGAWFFGGCGGGSSCGGGCGGGCGGCGGCG